MSIVVNKSRRNFSAGVPLMLSLGGYVAGPTRVDTANGYRYESNAWATLTTLPSVLGYPGGGTTEPIASAAYLFGGSVNVAPYNTNYKYYNGVWSVRATVTVGVWVGAGETLLGKGYVQSGLNDAATADHDNQEYTDTTNVWAAKTDKTSSLYGTIGCDCLNKAYLYGGRDAAPNYYDTCDEYDSVGNAWAAKTASGTTVQRGVFVKSGVKLYVINGGNNTGVHADTDEYNPVGNSWAAKTDATVSKYEVSGAARLDLGYCFVFGGHDTVNPLATHYYYNPTANTHTSRTNLPVAKFGLRGARVS